MESLYYLILLKQSSFINQVISGVFLFLIIIGFAAWRYGPALNYFGKEN
jgi:hypothetical protein